MRLLDRAKELKTKKNKRTYNSEELELVIAWFNGTVELHQIQKVLNMKAGLTVYSFIAFATRQMYQSNKLIIK